MTLQRLILTLPAILLVVLPARAGEGHGGDDAFWREAAALLPAWSGETPEPGPSSEDGEWGPVVPWPHVPVSAALLPNGKLLTYSGQENRHWPGTATRTRWTVYDPATRTFETATYNDHEMFCAGMAMRSDGMLQTIGGRYTVRDSSVYDFRTNKWKRVAGMFGRRWYGTSVALPDGDVLAFAGQGSPTEVETYDHQADAWRVLGGLNWPVENWPHVLLTPSGRLFHFGPNRVMSWVDTEGNGRLESTALTVPGTVNPVESTFVMYDIGKVLAVGGYQEGNGGDASNIAYTIDFNGETPSISLVPGGMAEQRQFANAVVLPNGEVLVLGGNRLGRKFTDTGGLTSVELWNPDTGQFRTVGAMSVPRAYHSSAMLLPDGRVFCGGGGYGGDGTETSNHDDAQFFTPPALFAPDGSLRERPELGSSPESISCGSVFGVSGSPGIARFAAIRLSSTNHAMNTDQRRISLPFSEVSAGSYQVIAHPNPNVMVPGYWMLFGIYPDGAYSEARIMHVKETGSSPDAGLRAEYFGRTGLSDFKFSRIDHEVNFNWGEGSPDFGLLGNNRYSVRWTGEVVPDFTEDYTFHVTADDGVRLWVDGRQLVNRWSTTGGGEDSGTITLRAGEPVSIRMEVFEENGPARAELRWSSARTPKQIIPETHLRHQSGTGVARLAVNRVHELFVDGRLAGVGTTADQTYSASFEPGSGTTTIALRACNLGGDPFVIGDFLIGGERVVTDGRWKVSTTAPEGWREPGFDDSAWEEATVLGAGAPAGVEGFPGTSAALRVWAADAGAEEVYLRYTFDSDALRLRPVANRSDTVGGPVNFPLDYTAPEGIQLTFTATGLPAGLEIDPSSGIISGVLSETGSSQVTVSLSGSDGSSGIQSFQWTVRELIDQSLTREWWTGISGTGVADLLADARFPDSPSGSDKATAFPVGLISGDNYGTRLRGFLHIETTGDYSFWLSTDDGGELMLGTTDDPATARTIATVPGWSSPTEWDKYPEQQSAPVRLEAGRRYYLEILQKEGAGGDHINLAWRKPGESGISVLPMSVLSSYQPNRAPILTPFADREETVGTVVSLPVAASDADGDELSFGATGLPAGVGIDATTGLISGIPAEAGTGTVTVSVSDGRGGVGSASFQWVVNPDLQLEAGSAGVVDTGAVGSFTAGVTGGTGVSFSWNFGDGSPDTEPSSSPEATHTFSSPGRFTVTVTAVDANGSNVVRSFVQNVRGPLGGERAVASSSIIAVGAGEDLQAWNVNPDNDTVTVTAADGTRLAEIPAGDDPRSLAEAPDGRIWVVNKGEATIHVLNATTYLTDQVIDLPPGSEPHGLVFSPADGAAWVALEGTGVLMKRDGAGGALLDAVAVGATPRHLAIPGDGSRVYVSRFISPPVAGESGASPDILDGGGEVRAVDPSTLVVATVIGLEQSRESDFGAGGRGLPNYLGAMAISPDGINGWVPSKQDNIHRGVLRDTRQLNFQNTVRAVVSRVDLVAGAEEPDDRVDLDDASVASAAVYGPNGLHLFVALEGNREVAVVDAGDNAELFRVPVGFAPQGLALSADGTRLFVHNFMSRSVTALAIDDLVDLGRPEVQVLGTWETVSDEALAAEVLLGKQLFYDAADDRLARENYMSCAACHNAGGHDGRTWDLTGFGEGVRNTIDLRGRAGTAHGRLHWSANFDEVQDFEDQIRTLAGGTGLIAGGTPHPPLGEANAGRSAELDALAAYLGSLDTFGRSPHRVEDGSLTAEAVEGRQIFEAKDCTDCHGGSEFTDSPRGGLHDVGTLTANSGQRLGGALTRLDTPTLRGLWRGGPYLHDGSAATVGEAISAHSGVSLTGDEVARLEAYLLQIDDLEPAAPGGAALPVVDGDLSDWAPQFSLGTDPDDISGAANNIDLRELWMTESGTDFLLAYRNDTAVVPSWGDTIYFDTDRQLSTGFDMFGAVGADFMIQSGAVFAYTGTGSDWSWSQVVTVQAVVSGDVVEMSFPKSALGSPPRFALIFHGDNAAFAGGSGVDVFPDNAAGSSTGNRVAVYPSATPPTPAEDGIVVDGDLSEWPGEKLAGIDPDDISGTANNIDVREVWVADDARKIYLGYRNDSIIVPSWGDTFYLDTDLSTATGFSMFGVLGADFMIQEGTLYAYAGSGADWQWQLAGELEVAVDGSVFEASFDRSLIGDVTRFSLLFYGDNRAFPGGAGADLFPQNADGGSTGERVFVYNGGEPGPGIVVDGNTGDWPQGSSLGLDPDDISGAANLIDVRELRLTNEGDRCFVAYRNENDISPSWGDTLYFDTDSNAGSGFVMFGVLGADYMIQDGGVFRYTGSGTSWSWSFAGAAEQVVNGPVAELAFDLSLLGNPAGFRFLYHGDNAAHPGGSGVDLFPDNADGSGLGDRFVSYTVGGGGPVIGSEGIPNGLPPILTGPDGPPAISMSLAGPGAFALNWPTVGGFTDTIEWSTNLQDWNDYASVEGDGTNADLNLDVQSVGNPPDLYLRVRRTVAEP